MGDRERKSGKFLTQLICPYCHAELIRRNQWLLCRYHKIGYEIFDFGVNFQWESANRTLEVQDLATKKSR